MKETMGQVIKRLRKERNFTQEELAEQLGVTAQAVSKWESEIGLPDISQVVPLATVFSVPTDVLFGRLGVNDDEEVKKIIHEIEDMDNRSFSDQQEEMEVQLVMLERYREALKKYPNNTNLLVNASSHGYITARNISEFDESKQNEILTECIRWNELVIKYSSNIDEILLAKRWLMETYAVMNQYMEAEKIAESLPADFDALYGIRLAELKWKAGKQDEERRLRCYNIKELLSTLEHQVIMLANSYRDAGQYEDAFGCYNFIRDIIKSIYGDEEYVPPFHFDSKYLYTFPAFCLVKLERTDEAIDLLEESVVYENNQAKYYNVRENVTAPLLRECTFRYWGKEYHRDKPAEFLNYEKYFSSIANHPRYRALVDKVNTLTAAE